MYFYAADAERAARKEYDSIIRAYELAGLDHILSEKEWKELKEKEYTKIVECRDMSFMEMWTEG